MTKKRTAMENKDKEHRGPGLAVLNALSAAIEDSVLWPHFLRAVMRATGASRGALSAPAKQARSRLWIAEGFDEHIADQWHGYFRHIDPKFAAMVMPEPGHYTIDHGSDLVPDEQFCQTEFYKDYAGKHGMRWSLSAWVHPNAPNANAYGLLLFRGDDEPDFDRSAFDLLDLVMRHLVSRDRIGVANALSRAAGLAEEDAAVYLLNEFGGLVMSNQRGADMIAAGSVVDGGKTISFSNHNLNAWLGALISEGGLNSKAFGSVARQRDSLEGFGAVQFTICPFRPIGATLSLTAARYALTLKVQETRAVPDLARAAHQMYRWTGAELDTVRRLTAGDELPNIALARNCSVETVRSHLKNAKRKAGVKRQVDLVRLMMALES